ncbi:TIGR00730 family Rossman fold protein [Nonomuraea insulae]|uniref:Cytokinin riboside 5'-monophosphate phosphoribohydrolase n=1 Tax=Nonomuraea insulae TaxID=1616787 RepID=A0ABW1D6D2_9ACTN
MTASDLRRFRVCVFCGSRPGSSSQYMEFATQLGKSLAKNDIDVVYGGGRTGIMGALAEGAASLGGHVTGIIPHHLLEREQAAGFATQLHVVGSMHDRKRLMYQLADGFVALPGGMGTMEELMEVLTWAQLDLHDKPVTVANVGGFFDPMLTWLDQALDCGFISSADRALVTEVTTVDSVLARLYPTASVSPSDV